MKIGRPFATLSVACLLIASASLSPAQAAGSGSCVACHADESKMKLLVKLPAAGPQEGEG